MHDIKAIRDNPQAFDAALKRRGVGEIAARLLEIDASRREAIGIGEAAKAKRNKLSKEIGIAKSKGLDTTALMNQVSIDRDIEEASLKSADDRDAELKALLETLPNLPDADVPDGADESANKELRKSGAPRQFNFKPRDHVELGEKLGLMDFAAAAKISGARFVVLKGALARLERALAQFMLDLHTGEHGYTEVNPPLLVNDDAVYGTGQLPKFKDDLFHVTYVDHDKVGNTLGDRLKKFLTLDSAKLSSFVTNEQDQTKNPSNYAEFLLRGGEIDRTGTVPRFAIPLTDLYANSASSSTTVASYVAKTWPEAFKEGTRESRWLVPTAEVPLTNLAADMIIEANALPWRLTAWTPCFRSEAGAAGKDTRGMIRQHQFPKVEMVSIVAAEHSEAEHQRMTEAAEKVLQRLGLPFRTVILCAGDMGFSARKTYDIEVWLPGQNAYREISSCSNCGDFQARRMNARHRVAGEKGTRFVHTLNGSGVAVGRALIAVLENYQQEDGSVVVPDALRAYMGGLELIEPVSAKNKK